MSRPPQCTDRECERVGMRRRPDPAGDPAALAWWCMFHPDSTPPPPPDAKPTRPGRSRPEAVPARLRPAPPPEPEPEPEPEPTCPKQPTCPKPPRHRGRCVGPQSPPLSTLTGPCPRSAECDRGLRHAGKCSKPKKARPAPVRGRTVQIPVRFTPAEAEALRVRASESGATLNDDLRGRMLAGLTLQEGPPQ